MPGAVLDLAMLAGPIAIIVSDPGRASLAELVASRPRRPSPTARPPQEGEPTLDELGGGNVAGAHRAGVDVRSDTAVDIGRQFTVDHGIEETPQAEMLDVAGE
jgi:hypothetical protein